MRELNLMGLHLQDVTLPFSVKTHLPIIKQANFQSAFTTFSIPRGKKIIAVIPQKTGLFFNSYPLEIGEIGLANAETPCLIQSKLEQSSSFLIYDLSPNNRHFQLLASTSMPVMLSKSIVTLHDDLEAYQQDFESALRDVTPPMRPSNLKGRSRIPRKNFVRDFVVKICKTLNTKQAIQWVANEYQMSERTARDGFNDIIGVTPKQFMLLQQMFTYRQRLVNTQTGSIESVATELGITARGRMAGQYYQHFGEKPSQTLKRHLSKNSCK
ncbi:helix-turn-helix domain-containing protein [Vibrio rumoiensis]|uniref:HTH araC/xylS-type domain-containing protein n=1 Tax=Vibrio rumoiensis 1S-45 TaxID=1188252 RepID=A0A1E5E476_9VIBR|nr:helix-turn-helix domain-containing protein [Vibrio rumoiensis]OEF27547.1 hypothetical protein A1QC_06390 [Vibrio rumoiensis 1S-45]